LVFAKYILLPQKTSANFRAPFIGISVISFCAVVPIKAAALLFYALAIELHLLQLSVFVFDDMYIMLLVLQAIAVHQKLVPSLYVMYIATP
jgi:hypothetical protein